MAKLAQANSTLNSTLAYGVGSVSVPSARDSSTMCRQVIAAAAALAMSTFATNSYINSEEKIPTEAPSPLAAHKSHELNEALNFVERDVVMAYIDEHDNVADLLKTLPFLVEAIFKDSSITLSVFEDYEEDFKNLRVEISSAHEIEELDELEEKLFAKLEANDSLVDALEHVTIACV